MKPRPTLHLVAALLAAVSLSSTTRVLAQEWNRRFPANAPPPMTSSRMVYDAARSRMVLFGGVLNNNVSTLNDLTWEYDGLDWTTASTPTKPGGRYGQYMTYDPVRRVTVMFGGSTGASSVDGGTWEYDGVTWTLINPAVSPPPRSFGNMVYDLRTGMIVLLGGFDSQATRTNDTWEYDGVARTWTPIPNAGNPDQAGQYAMAYDELRGKTIVFGGINTNFALVNTLWEYDGTSKTWSKPTITGPAPSARRLVSGVFVLPRRVMVIHGGDVFPGHLGDTWEYDVLSQTWTDRTVAGSGPGLNQQNTFAYDIRRESIVLWGGYTGTSPRNFVTTDWTWEHGFRGTFRPFGSGCRGSSAIGIPTLAATSPGPITGLNMDTRMSPAPNGAIVLIGFSNVRHESGLLLPINLTPLGAIGCTLYTSTHLILPVAPAAGVADFRLPIPLDSNLTGLKYYQQALVTDFGINPLHHVLTNAAEATIL